MVNMPTAWYLSIVCTFVFKHGDVGFPLFSALVRFMGYIGYYLCSSSRIKFSSYIDLDLHFLFITMTVWKLPHQVDRYMLLCKLA